jgi:serine/threonine protein kinase
LGRYVVESRLGVGGMAEVFRARLVGAEGFSRAVALKRVAPALSEDERFASLFIAEARIAALLTHPNIVSVLDFDRDEDGVLFLAMELVDGPDLRRLAAAARRRGTPVAPRLAAFVAGEILRALAYAHELKRDDRPLGIVHRDVSPHNVLVSRTGSVKLTDFGIAKATAAATASRSGTVKGKLSYMSPEQASGGSPDGRADVYAVGVLLYELLAGERPYDGATETETLARVLRGGATPVERLVPGLPPDLAALTMRLFALRREDRPAGAADALKELRATSAYPADGEGELARLVSAVFPSGTPVGLDPVPAAGGSRRIRPSRRLLGILAVVAALSVAVTIAVWLVPQASVPSPPATATAPSPAPPPPSVSASAPAPSPERRPMSVPEPEPPAPPRPTQRPGKPVPALPDSPGTLTVRARSWAVVEVDGEAWGQTPVTRRGLPPGRHRIVLANEDAGKRDVRQVDVKPGEDEVVSVDW